MKAIRKSVRLLAVNERGATAIEYGLIVSLIAMAAMGAFNQLGNGSTGMWATIDNKVPAAP